jgi:hypothetical protein
VFTPKALIWLTACGTAAVTFLLWADGNLRDAVIIAALALGYGFVCSRWEEESA